VKSRFLAVRGGCCPRQWLCSSARDFGLVGQLHAWRNQVVRFNAGLAVAEMLAFTVESESVLRDLHEGLHAHDGQLIRLRTAIEALQAQLPAER
jgi:transposase-like protein